MQQARVAVGQSRGEECSLPLKARHRRLSVTLFDLCAMRFAPLHGCIGVVGQTPRLYV